MTKLIDLPSEVLREICLLAAVSSESDFLKESSVGPFEEDLWHRNRLTLFYRYMSSKLLNNSFLTAISCLHAAQGGNLWDFFEGLSCDRCERKRILALSLSCKRLHDIIEPLLWSIVETDHEKTGSNADIIRLFHTITKRPQIGPLIKALAFRHFYSYTSEDALSFTKEEAKEMKLVLELSATHQLASFLNALPNLRALKLTVETIPDSFDVFSPLKLHSLELPLGLQNLNELSFHWEDPDADGFYASMLLPLFLLPSLKTLYLARVLAVWSDYNSDSDPEFDEFKKHYGTSTITSLIIDFSLVETGAINAFCKLPRKLERFEYSFGGGSNRCNNADLDEYYHALLPQKSTLKTLKIRGCRDMRMSEDEEIPNPAILNSFTALKEFACPFRLLIFRDWGGSVIHKLENFLPPTLNKVTLFAYDDWNFECMHETVQNFLIFGKNKLPGLQEMRLEIWLQEEDHIKHSYNGNYQDRKREAEGIIRQRVENIMQRAKDEGVMLEVMVDTLSKTMDW